MTIGFHRLKTRFGPFSYLHRGGIVLASGWTDEPGELLALIHPTLRPATTQAGADQAISDAVTAYHDGELAAIDTVGVEQHSGPFIEAAWHALRTVRPGQPVTYRQFARLAGRPQAVRAAAAACAYNAAALFVPCHRIIRTDGGLGGFRYGLPIKEQLLRHESQQPV